jgi:hypothetical protein
MEHGIKTTSTARRGQWNEVDWRVRLAREVQCVQSGELALQPYYQIPLTKAVPHPPSAFALVLMPLELVPKASYSSHCG